MGGRFVYRERQRGKWPALTLKNAYIGEGWGWKVEGRSGRVGGEREGVEGIGNRAGHHQSSGQKTDEST